MNNKEILGRAKWLYYANACSMPLKDCVSKALYENATPTDIATECRELEIDVNELVDSLVNKIISEADND